MKSFTSIILIALCSFIACIYLPWWVIAVVSFLISVTIPQQAGKAYLTGFTAIFLLWVGIATAISFSNNFIFAHKISLLILKIDNPILLITVTGLLGGIVAGFAAMAGSFLRVIK